MHDGTELGGFPTPWRVEPCTRNHVGTTCGSWNVIAADDRVVLWALAEDIARALAAAADHFVRCAQCAVTVDEFENWRAAQPATGS